jgi:splicing factor 3A subunit 2
MDFQNRVGSKKGGGGVASESQANADRRERLRKLALETIDLTKDPYFLKVHTHTVATHTVATHTHTHSLSLSLSV